MISEPPSALQSFTETGRSLGLVAGATVLLVDEREATIEESESLRIAPGAPIIAIERLRTLDGVPVALHMVRIPLDRAPDLARADFSNMSIYAALKDAGHTPTRGDCDVRSEPPTSRDRELLAAVALLVVRQITFNQRGEPIELMEMRYRGDRYRMKTTLHGGPNAVPGL